jgi:ribonuclease HI
MVIQVYSDGSATTKENAGGWGAIVIVNGILHKELSGHLESATNNDAELIASIKGLDCAMECLCSPSRGDFDEEADVTLISDSEIVLNWANGKYRFKQIDKMPLYDHLMRLMKKMNVKTRWVKGHSGDPFNERCDKLANNARKGITTQTLDKPPTEVHTRIGKKKNGIVSLWHNDKLKVIDLENNIVEDYNREAHGKRGSVIEIRENKNR